MKKKTNKHHYLRIGFKGNLPAMKKRKIEEKKIIKNF